MSKKKKTTKSLQQQAYQRLESMKVFGESKARDKVYGDTKDKIYSLSTFKTYWKHIKYFIKYVRKQHPECYTLKKAKEYYREWLEYRNSKKLSAWTIQTEAKALGKLFRISPGDKEYYKPPVRHKTDAKRSRHAVKNDEYFSEEKNKELVNFLKNIGLRRSGATSIRKESLWNRKQIDDEMNKLKSLPTSAKNRNRLSILEDTKLFNEEWFIEVKEKGGRVRLAPIYKNNQGVIDKMLNTLPYNKVWPKINKNCDVHGYRGMYARNIYAEYARKLEDIPKFYFDKEGKRHFGLYYMRGENKGKVLDREALYKTSKALGHNRISVVADNYLYDLGE